jgi:hypothetical protein
MKKFYSFVFLLVFCIITSVSLAMSVSNHENQLLTQERETVRIGNGTDLTCYMPMHFCFKASLSETIYLSTEINTTGELTGITWYNSFAQNILNKPTKIWVGETSLAHLFNGWIPSTNLSLVFDGLVDYPQGENDINVEFDTPYDYQGGNLAIMVLRPLDTVEYIEDVNHFYDTVASTMRSQAAVSALEIDTTNPPAMFMMPIYPNISLQFSPGNGVQDPHVSLIRTELKENYPNPFNPNTIIKYAVKQTSSVTITVFNLKGQKVKTLIDEVVPLGDHAVSWNGKDDNDRDISSGVYFYKMNAGKYTSTKKMILLK